MTLPWSPPALASVGALLLVILISCFSRINVGVLGLGLAWLIGIGVAQLPAGDVVSGFPTGLLLTLLGVTLLFGAAEANGTLERLAVGAVGLARGRRALVPVILFGVAFVISSVGPGAILAVAVTAPLAMAIGGRAGVSPLVVALMVANGANAGNLTPVSAVGVIANTNMAEAGLPGQEGKVFLAGALAHLLVTVVGFAALHWRGKAFRPVPVASGDAASHRGFTRRDGVTVLVIVGWIVGVVWFRLHLGFSAFAAAAVLFLLRQVNEAAAFRKVPVGIIVMVTGVSTLVALLEKTGGMEVFTGLLARLATSSTVNGVMGFVTGLISTYSSTSAVVLPAFLPTAPGLAAQVGGDPVAISLSITVGSALVDVSPLSTLGALCVAAIAVPEEATRLFRELLVWGLSMVVVGALVVQLFAGVLARL